MSAPAPIRVYEQPAPAQRRRAESRLMRFCRGLAAEWRMATWAARLSALCLLAFYFLVIASPFVASYDPTYQYRNLPDCPPMPLRLSPPSQWAHGFFYAYPMKMVDPIARRYVEDRSRIIYVRLFHRGHLLTSASVKTPWFMMGSDGLGRDLFSRIVYGSRVSMNVGLIGVLISFSLGIAVGAFSGYAGGAIDNLIMRWTEIEMSLPAFYFLLALAAIIPSGVSTVVTFFLIVAIMSFIGWAGFARVIRGMSASIRSVPYVEAARALGASRARMLVRHVIPSVMGYAIVAATLSIPGYILGESALSLLGLGIQEPASSWGNLLAAAQDPQSLARYPWILIPGAFIFFAVMSFNFLGDYLRDRLDPSNID
jgi:peptide/nickel transport system permease protein